MPKIIILRGNSGSVKTTIAKELQKNLERKTMLISQDTVRREMLNVKGDKQKIVKELLLNLILFGKNNCDIVILEGILNSKKYIKLFKRIKEEFKDNIFAYYFDIPFEETLNRHSKRACAKEFGKEKMKEWWLEKDFMKIIPEKLLGKELTIEEIVSSIINDIKNSVEEK